MVSKWDLARHPEKMRAYLEQQARGMTQTQGLKLANKLDEMARKKYHSDASLFCLKEKHKECSVYLTACHEQLQKPVTCSCPHHDEERAAIESAHLYTPLTTHESPVEDGGPSV